MKCPSCNQIPELTFAQTEDISYICICSKTYFVHLSPSGKIQIEYHIIRLMEDGAVCEFEYQVNHIDNSFSLKYEKYLGMGEGDLDYVELDYSKHNVDNYMSDFANNYMKIRSF